jgi:trk system potassium uptake protein TrkH
MLTITASFVLFTGRRMEKQEEQALADALAVGREEEMARVLRRVLLTTASIEAAGALALFLLWSRSVADAGVRGWWALFHAVSAFCNAGFSLFPGSASLTGFASDPWTLAVIGLLIVMGGLGFVVLADLGSRLLPSRGRAGTRSLRRHTRWTLALTAGLLAGGTILFAMLEGDGVLRGFGPGQRWLNAAFQSVTLRTAGFNTIDPAGLSLAGSVFCIVWMLIGGSPGGTAGGMKTTTAAAALAAVLGRPEAPPSLRRRATRLALVFLGSYAVFAAGLALITARFSSRIAFEAASALGTVGLSMGVTWSLGTGAKLFLCAAMFAGRVGPFAVVAVLARRREGTREAAGIDRIELG